MGALGAVAAMTPVVGVWAIIETHNFHRGGYDACFRGWPRDWGESSDNWNGIVSSSWHYSMWRSK